MLTAKLILERLDKEGRLLERKEQQSRSFVKNFISLLYCAHAQIQSGAPYTMTDVDGNARTVDSQTALGYPKGNLKVGSSGGGAELIVGNGNYWGSHTQFLGFMLEASKVGIQVGTGTTAVTPTDTALATRILHGSAASKLEYGGCELLSIAFANPNGQFTIRRYFTNNSGGVITVEEVGIYSVGTDYDRFAWAFLIARDLTGGVAVANTEILRATYVPQITV